MDKIKDVAASLWISASAGTGKTKSLIDRIAALLLNGANPSKILCLTYTKAAASEMLMRLSDYLQKLSKTSLEELKSELLAYGADESQIETAKSLYEKSIGNDKVSIQTIHGFCFELLGRFPLETGLFPGIKICDDQKWEQLLNESVNYVLADEECRFSWKIVAKYMTDVGEIFKENAMALQRFMNQSGNFLKLYADFFDLDMNWLHLNDDAIDDLLFSRLFSGDYKKNFADCAEILSSGSKSDREKGEILKENSASPSEKFVYAFLTLEGTLRKRLFTKKINAPDFQKRMEDLASKALDFLEAKKRITSVKANAAFFEVMRKIFFKFQELKIANHYLDFDDVILLTAELLRNADWVMYKIDGGIEHLLVDEAQDTSPEQWEVIAKITEEFFSNYQSDRTIFVVGDEKQSIYSCQGADVKLFGKMRDYLGKSSRECGQKFYDEPLHKSYRTTGNILSFVDDVFAEKFPRVSHSTYRNPNGGVVEIVDVFTDDETNEENNSEEQSAEKKLSSYVANFIKKTIEDKVFVESKERSALAADFLILFQHRDLQVMKYIIDALQRENIPVAGIDRILLKDELAIEDLIALAEFAVFPLDDLMCARVLKSPIVGISENELMRVCLDRKDDCLWVYLKKINYPQLRELQNYVDNALKLSAYDFFMYVLTDGVQEKLIGRLGEKCLDVLNEFLNVVMKYEKENTASLPNFLESFRSYDYEIKRESFEDKNAVRLMTVHASKGLQSPFVILADCHFMNTQRKKLIKTEDGILLWDFFAGLRPNKITELLQEERDDEYYRLLYVAMTRAQDFLYILGEKHKNPLNDKCWYNFTRRKLDKFARVESEGLYRLGNYRYEDSNGWLSPSISIGKLSEIPHWFHEKLSVEDREDQNRIERDEHDSQTYGNCVHLLLAEMPKYWGDVLWGEIADQLLENFDLSDDKKEEAKAESANIIKKFDFLFDKKSLSEVSFAHNGKEGRIDKIAFRNDELWIVDFKTGPSYEVIPENYVLQLKLYRDAVQNITKNQVIKTAILWTRDESLVEIDIAQTSQGSF
ncbi:MAG: UvrD-helicase domain-containing protein [Holosporaceae bacterium]|jgi:ATP-dependent helicase/nuclease subunit A|nr:UvrD-helicase domain-containing protein [Holosporaceae bacterium]